MAGGTARGSGGRTVWYLLIVVVVVAAVVAAAASKVAWTFAFVPRDAAGGSVTYAYSIPSAGESHSATGTYTTPAPDTSGTVHVSLALRDHVVFHGFDGNIPLKYKFDLVPSPGAVCSSSPSA